MIIFNTPICFTKNKYWEMRLSLEIQKFFSTFLEFSNIFQLISKLNRFFFLLIVICCVLNNNFFYTQLVSFFAPWEDYYYTFFLCQ